MSNKSNTWDCSDNPQMHRLRGLNVLMYLTMPIQGWLRCLCPTVGVCPLTVDDRSSELEKNEDALLPVAQNYLPWSQMTAPVFKKEIRTFLVSQAEM